MEISNCIKISKKRGFSLKALIIGCVLIDLLQLKIEGVQGDVKNVKGVQELLYPRYSLFYNNVTVKTNF
jgi:hypothetical protein